MSAKTVGRAREVATTVGIMKQGRLVPTFPTGEFSHIDLEKLYLEHMR